MIALAPLALAGCLAIPPAADRIVFQDLAAAFPEAAGIAPGAVVAPAPAPGVRLVFHLPELRRLALRLHLAAEPQSEVCIERPVGVPDPARFLAAMQKELAPARIEILESSRQPTPDGEIAFPAAGLRPAGGAAFWAGYVRFAGNRRFSVWARVRVTVEVRRVVAAADLAPGRPIDPAQLRLETRDQFPYSTPFSQSLAEVAGQWPRLPIRAGAAIRADQLQTAREVMQGETVRVDVRDGAAHLELEACAEASGGPGEIIPLRNPISHRRFLARVVGKGRVSVDSSILKVNP